jgi:hypothetical protein
MGQGRYVHPARPRTITPHEAARLQTLPDFFDLGSSSVRSTWAHVIGNAVPPFLGIHLGVPFLRAMLTDATNTAYPPKRADARHAVPLDGWSAVAEHDVPEDPPLSATCLV